MSTAVMGSTAPRIRASLIHLLISALVVSAVLLIVYFVWYPWPFSDTNQVHFVAKILIGVDIVLGPLLTFVVFNANKPASELRRDLGIIGFVQFCALAYGTYALYSERPGFLAYIGDRFEVVPAMSVREEGITEGIRQVGLLDGPQPVWIKPPTTVSERDKVLTDLAEGRGQLREQASRYEPVNANVQRMRVLELSISDILADSLNGPRTAERARLEAFEKAAAGQRMYQPLDGRKKSMVAALDRGTGEILDYFDLMPWHAAELASVRLKANDSDATAVTPQTPE